VQFSVEYPDRPLNRLTTAFRIFVAIPILIVLATVSGGTPVPAGFPRASLGDGLAIRVRRPKLRRLFRRRVERVVDVGVSRIGDDDEANEP
jgi:hypothetical protein